MYRSSARLRLYTCLNTKLEHYVKNDSVAGLCLRRNEQHLKHCV